jgi:acyl-CoA thioester hydrolase
VAADSARAALLSERATFSSWTLDRLRMTDVDYQGHVTNSVHPVFFTNGRHNFIQRYVRPCVAQADMTALVKITIEYLREMHHPGDVEVGTLIQKLGSKSITLGQGMFNEGRCVAVASSVVVLLDRDTRRAKPWTDSAVAQLAPLVVAGVSG